MPVSTADAMMKRMLFSFLKILAVAAVAGGLLNWRLWAPITVESHIVERGALASEVMGTGTLEARTQTMISPKIAGRILELTVDEGDKVKAGQKLVSLDDAELQQQVAIAAANVEVAESNIDRLESDQARAVAVVKQATSSHERKVSLASQSAISREELDQSLEALTVAQAGLGASESAIVQGKKSLLAAQELLTANRAWGDEEILPVTKTDFPHWEFMNLQSVWLAVWPDQPTPNTAAAKKHADIANDSDVTAISSGPFPACLHGSVSRRRLTARGRSLAVFSANCTGRE